MRPLATGLEDATQVVVLPAKYRRRLRTTVTEGNLCAHMLERTIDDVRRREKVIRTFPNERSVLPLLGAFFAELHEEWSTRSRYLNIETYGIWKRAHDGEEITERVA